MLLTNERDHIRNAYLIIDDMQELAKANIRKGDCSKIDDYNGIKYARYDELHRAFVLYSHVIDYLEDLEIITKELRKELVERFGDITDELENPTQPAPNTK